VIWQRISLRSASRRDSSADEKLTIVPTVQGSAPAPSSRHDGDPALKKSPGDLISDSIRESYERVPEIGAGGRWYDLPYRSILWLLSASRRKLLPGPIRERLIYALNYLLQFNEHDRQKAHAADNARHGIRVPRDDHVVIPGVWVVELFPPSEFSSLQRTIKRNS
jgi:hypothetical protein